MKRFAEHPFQIMMDGKEFNIGRERRNLQCASNIRFPSQILRPARLWLSEAYMEGKLDIEGDLYHALDQFLGQMGKFSTDRKGLKNCFYPALSKKTRRQR